METRAFLSEKLITAVKMNPEPNHLLAIRFHLNPSQLSRFMTRVETVKPGDKRILKLAKSFGLSAEEAFDQIWTAKGESK